MVHFFIVILTLIVLSGTAPSARAQDACPPIIITEQKLTPPKGWNLVIGSEPQRLTHVTFFEGVPDDEGALAPDEEYSKGDNLIVLWRFTSGRSQGVWMACSYSGSTLQLAKPLLPGVESCSVIYNSDTKIAGHPEIKSISCKE